MHHNGVEAIRRRRYVAPWQNSYAPTTINLRLAAVRRVAYEAAEFDLLGPELAAGIPRVKGVRRIGVRVGNWLTAAQGKRLLATADRDSLRGKRNYAVLAMLIGCGLRRGELLDLHVESMQLREEHWVIADFGQGRTCPYGSHSRGVKEAVDAWKEARGITEAHSFDQSTRPADSGAME